MLTNASLDLAVAFGAAYYGVVRRGGGIRIGGGTARSYYVGFLANRVVIYKGVPGGVLGWDPTVEQPTRLTAGQLTQIDRERVAGGGGRGSLSHALGSRDSETAGE